MVAAEDIGNEKFQDCDTTEITLQFASFWNEEFGTNVTNAMNSLGYLENEFKCASMCANPPRMSPFYTFSDVSK